MSFQPDLFIERKIGYVPSSSGETITIYNPNDDSLVTGKVQAASEQDVDRAVAAAKKAFPVWRDTTSSHRAALMLKFADLLEENLEKIAKLESIAMGYYAGLAGKVAGESFPPDADGICAWNATHVLAAFKMAPAMATGNIFVLKSSEKSPLGTCIYGDLLNKAGFPPGVVNVIAGAGPVGSLLARHMEIAKIAFTGSSMVDREIMAAAARSILKRVSLELGGKSPALIFDDANLDNAVEHNSVGFLRNSGQICFGESRVLVQESTVPKFIEKFKVAFENAEKPMGDPSLASTAFGPLADKKQFDRAMAFLTEAKKEGVEVLVGGERLGDKGPFIRPTVFLNPDVRSRIFTEEVFVPAISVKTFKTEDEAIELANNTSYGLGAAVYTTNIARALRIATKIEAGSFMINSAFRASVQTLFGGYKQSGIGKEGGAEGLKEYVQAKTIHINMMI